jgi:hypothetical protein
MSEELEVRSTSVSITLNGKSVGIDAFVKLEETLEFPNAISAVDALVKREELAARLTAQVLDIVRDMASTVKGAVTPPVPQVQHPAVGGHQGQPVTAIVGAANNAAVGSGALDWRNAPDRFDATKTVRYLSTTSFTIDQLRASANAWLAQAGFNAGCFDVWDERNDAEKGRPISSVCNIKVKKELHALVPADVVSTNTGGVKAVARAKFNSDGSLFFYWSKDAEAAIKYGAFAPLSGAAPVPASSEEEPW